MQDYKEYIDCATEKFAALLQTQLERSDQYCFQYFF